MGIVTTVLFDIDGTLLDSNDAHAQSWKKALRAFGYHVPYDRLRPLIGKGGDKLLAEVAGIVDSSEESKHISAERKRIFSLEFLPRLRPTPGARELLQRLRADGFQLSIATSAAGDESKDLLQQAGVDELIPLRSSSDDAQASKPDPDIVKAALRKAGVRPLNAVLVGDTPHDMEAARRAGVRAVALRCGGWWDDRALSGAVRIYDDPADLLQRLTDSPLER